MMNRYYFSFLATMVIGMTTTSSGLLKASESVYSLVAGPGITLAGTTEHPKLAQASVEIIADGQSFSGMTDDDGRYAICRPPVSEKRLFLTARGDIGYTLKTPYRDGTTHVIFEPLDFIARLAALAPAKAASLLASLLARRLAGVPISAFRRRALTCPTFTG